jgi:IS5 family transposase
MLKCFKNTAFYGAISTRIYRLFCENFVLLKHSSMYKSITTHQVSFSDFNQSCGMQLDESNEWISLATQIDWDAYEKMYAKLFPSRRGHPAKPLRMDLGALIIQKRKRLSNRALVEDIAENSYLQYFIGMKQYAKECPFEVTSLVAFRKRLSSDFLMQINEMFLEKAGGHC